jgi:hypothetical protein
MFSLRALLSRKSKASPWERETKNRDVRNPLARQAPEEFLSSPLNLADVAQPASSTPSPSHGSFETDHPGSIHHHAPAPSHDPAASSPAAADFGASSVHFDAGISHSGGR